MLSEDQLSLPELEISFGHARTWAGYIQKPENVQLKMLVTLSFVSA